MSNFLSQTIEQQKNKPKLKKDFSFLAKPHNVFANKFAKGASGSLKYTKKIGKNELSLKANVSAVKPKDKGTRVKSNNQTIVFEKSVGKNSSVGAVASGNLLNKKVDQFGLFYTKKFKGL